MKGTGANLVKQIISTISCVSRAKCMAIRTKTDAMKARLMVTALTVLSKKKKFSIAAISGKINRAIDGIFNHGGKDIDSSDHEVMTNNAIVLYNKSSGAAAPTTTKINDEDDGDDDRYPDLRHSLFDEEEEQELADLLDDPNSSMSVIDIVKNSKENAENFNLEDEIDEVADLFISKFHKRMRLQKLLSFKRYQQMMERSA